MSRKEKSKAQLKAELTALKRQRSGDRIASIANHLIRWCGLVAITYLATRCIEALAGRRTLAEIGLGLDLGFLVDMNLDRFLAWLVAVLGLGYGARQRALRKAAIGRLASRVRDLETRLDPGRTSSGLTGKGDTNPADL